MIELQKLSFRYGKAHILKACSAQIPKTAVCIGPNGCGKTTLLKLIAGILLPDEGRIQYKKKIEYSSSVCFNDGILFNHLTIEQHFQWLYRHAHLSDQNLKTHLDAFQLTTLYRHRPSSLSQGQRQWVSLALTCMMPADLLLLDEPFQHLDDAKIGVLCKILKQMAASDRGILLTAHAPIRDLNFPVWEFPTP